MKSTLAKLTTTITTYVLGITTFISLPTHADDVCSSNAPAEVKAAAGCSGAGSVGTLPDAITSILNAIILVSGLIAVIFIIVGGINYMTSSGDAAKVKKAKDTILYSVIGLIICVLAFAIVNFVIVSLLKQG